MHASTLHEHFILNLDPSEHKPARCVLIDKYGNPVPGEFKTQGEACQAAKVLFLQERAVKYADMAAGEAEEAE